jgi:phospholipid transport system substrate-binding protein
MPSVTRPGPAPRRRSGPAPKRLMAVGAALGLGLLVAGGAWAGPPTDELRHGVDQVLTILEDPKLKRPDALRERRDALRQIANEVFDLPEMAKRALGRHWQARTPAEREEFTRLFADVLERAYLAKIDLYTGEKVAFVGESIDGNYATVRTRIVTKHGTEIPVDYRLLRHGERWRAYDVAIEGVSLVANYRTQFNTVIQRSSYDGLLKALRAKQDERVTESPGQRAQHADGGAGR